GLLPTAASASTPGPPTPVLGAPGTPPPARAARRPGSQARVLMIGDSVALTLGDALKPYAAKSNIALTNAGILGCGIARGGPFRYFGQVSKEPKECPTWPDRWTK